MNKFKAYASKEEILALDVNTMLHIVRFFLCDAMISVSRERLEPYVKEHYKQPDKIYRISSQQKFILIRK